MNIDLKTILQKLTAALKVFKRYQTIVFIILLALIYGFLVFRINTLSSQQPSDADIALQQTASKSPHIDQTVVDKIQQLQDNSVQVKTLFSNARKNPFSE